MNNLVKDFEMNSSLEKVLSFCMFMSLFFLAVGALTSISILSLSHVFIILPALYFIPKANYKNYPKSAWALLAFAVVLVLSVVVNQDIIANGYKNISKTKYFFIGFLSIAPLSWYFNKRINQKTIKILIYTLLFCITVSSVYGLVKLMIASDFGSLLRTGYFRNAGLMKNIMNYAHNSIIVITFLIGLSFIKNFFKEIISKKVFYGFLVINLIGLFFSFTRGAWLGLLVSLIFIFIGKESLKKVLGVITLLGLIGFLAYKTSGHLVIRAGSDEKRISQWIGGYEAFKERPFQGVGYLNFEPLSKEIKARHGIMHPEYSGHAHSNIFEMLASFGVWSFVAFLIWKILWCFEIWRSQNYRVFILSFVAILVGGLTQSTIALGVNLSLIVFLYTLFIATSNKESESY